MNTYTFLLQKAIFWPFIWVIFCFFDNEFQIWSVASIMRREDKTKPKISLILIGFFQVTHKKRLSQVYYHFHKSMWGCASDEKENCLSEIVFSSISMNECRSRVPWIDLKLRVNRLFIFIYLFI